jgi:trigger factor
MKGKVNLKGFRPGKAPVSFLKKQFGKSVMGEVVQAGRGRGQPEGDQRQPAEARDPAAHRAGGRCAGGGGRQGRPAIHRHRGSDAGFRDHRCLQACQVERLVADVPTAEVDEALERIAKQTRAITARPEGEAAQKDDTVLIDFVGSVDGVEFEGGKGDDANLTLGSGQFIPGFEEQLIGAKAGDKRGREGGVPQPIIMPPNWPAKTRSSP